MTTAKTTINVSKIFSCYVVLIPIIEYYKSPLSGFNLATFSAMLFLVLFALLYLAQQHKRTKDRRMIVVWVYFLFMTANLFITSSMYDYSYSWSNLNVYVRFWVLFLSLLIFGHYHFDFSFAIKFMEKLLVVCAVLIFIQDFLYIFLEIGVNINIPALLTNKGYATYPGRAGGLYMEPAHYAQSSLIYLSTFLFDTKKSYKLSKTAFVIILFGVIASGSGQGYALTAVLFGIWFLNHLRITKLSVQKLFRLTGAALALGVVCLISLRIPFVQHAVSRFIGPDGSLGGQALAGRTYTNIIFQQLSPKEKIYGIGFGHLSDLTSGYANSLYAHLIQCGYLSLGVLVFIFLYLLIKGKPRTKAFSILYALMVCFASVATPMSLCFFLLFMLFDNEGSGEKEKT